MPGNEVGERIHNFLGQESLSQGQHQSQVIDGTWAGLSNNLWVGSQKQVGGPLLSNLKTFSVHQLAESDRGHSGQSSSLQHGLNFHQSGLRHEIARSQSQNHSPTVNGFMQGHQSFQARQNEANFLGGDTASRGLSGLDSQIGNGPDLHKKDSLRLESTESPVNYDFFGGQQQIGGQNPGMIPPLPRQQAVMADVQLLHQHAMLKQMQELQRQHFMKPQIQLSEARQLSSANQVPSVVKQGSGSLSPAPINGVPVHDASNYSWQPEHITANSNWLQHSGSPVLQGSSSGFMFSPEQGQARLMGLVPQQVDQSFYGISTGGGRGNPYQYSSVQMDKPLMQVQGSGNSFPGNQYAMCPDQVGLQDGSLVSRQGDLGKNMFVPTADQGLNNEFHAENLQQITIQPKDVVMQEYHGRQGHPGPSETLSEKSVIQAASAQTVATLDPTEEKILFGSDDNVWDIFGKSANMNSVLDNSDSFGAFSSLQSGSWSALMQSAVAETSSNETGGLAAQNSKPPTAIMSSSIVNDGSKQQTPWVDKNLQTASALNPKPFTRSTDANVNPEFCSVPGVQQLGVQTANQQVAIMQNNPSQKFVEQFMEDRSKWLDCSSVQKPVAESAQLFGNVAHSPKMQLSAKSISSHQQGMAAYSPRGQSNNKPNGWNFIDSSSHSSAALSKSQGNKSSLQPSHDQRGALYEKGHGSALDHPVLDGNTLPDNVNSPQVNREGSDMDNVAAITDSRTISVARDSSHQLLNNHNLNIWRSVDTKVSSGLSRVPATYQQNLDKSPQAFEPSGNHFLDKGASEANLLEKPNVKETANDGFCSNLFQNTSTGGMRDNVWLDANDSRGKQKSSVALSRKPSGVRKFQYHPMGDLDVDVEPYGTKIATHLPAMSQHVSLGLKVNEQGYFGQSKFSGHAAGESTEAQKGGFAGIQVDEIPSRSSSLGSAPDHSFGGLLPSRTAPMSQNMLELFHKVDQPKECSTATHVSSSERNQSSEMPDTETSDGSVGQFQHNRPSASQGFGLQLGPPYQRFAIPDQTNMSQRSSQGVNSLYSAHVPSEVGRMGHTWLGPTASVQSSNYGVSHGAIRNNVSSVSGQTSDKVQQSNIKSNVSSGFTSDYRYLSQVIPNESVKAPSGSLASQSKQTDESFERAQTSQLGRKPVPHMSKTSPDNDIASLEASQPSSGNQNHERDLGRQFPVLEAMQALEPSATSEPPRQGAFAKISPNVWTSVSAPQHISGAKSSLSQNMFKPNHHSSINSETTHPGTEKLDDPIARSGRSDWSELPAGSAKPQSSVEEEQSGKAEQVLPENDAAQDSATIQRDIEASGRSLRPNNALHQSYSLLHQVHAMKNVDVDPSNRSVKRFRGPEPGSDAQQACSVGAEQLPYGSDTMMRDTPVDRPLVPAGDSKMLNFSSNSGENRDTQLSSNDRLASSRNDSQHFSNANNSATNLRGEHPQISPQMAPSWFNRYGTFNNGLMLPVYDARSIGMMKAAEKAIIVGRPSDGLPALHSSEQVNAASDSSQLDYARQSSTHMPIASGHISSHLLPPDTSNQNLAVVRAKKRKSMTFELLAWHKEVTQGSQRPQNINAAEMEWAYTANRLIEKVEDEPEMIEDWPPVLKSKRRLILTTQLMQQVLCAPPRVVLYTDASKNYETVAYFVARSVLGDACSTACIPERNIAVLPDSGRILSEKLKEERNQSILKAAEEFIIGVKKLENELQSLEKRTSVLDLRVECQDLEKFSVINRFAKFHGRGQADGAETSSSNDAIASSQKFFLQRYVTALPMPKNLPDRVQCLSL